MNSIKKYIKIGCICVIGALAMASCKEEDPWVDATTAPLLVDIVGAPFGYPQEKEPTVGYKIADGNTVKLTARLLELDKSNMLDNTIGIDSIPVSGVKVSISLRAGTVLGEATSTTDGIVTIDKTWAELGVAAPAAGSLVKISWTGSYNGTTFTRFSQVQAK